MRAGETAPARHRSPVAGSKAMGGPLACERRQRLRAHRLRARAPRARRCATSPATPRSVVEPRRPPARRGAVDGPTIASASSVNVDTRRRAAGRPHQVGKTPTRRLATIGLRGPAQVPQDAGRVEDVAAWPLRPLAVHEACQLHGIEIAEPRALGIDQVDACVSQPAARTYAPRSNA